MTTEASQLKNRLVVSAALVSAALYAIFWSPRWVFILVVEGFVLFGLNEFLSLAEKKGAVVNRWFVLFFAALFPLADFFVHEIIIFAGACLALFLYNFPPQRKDQVLLSTALTLFGLTYVAWFFSFLVNIYDLPKGPFWVFYTVLIVKLGDAGAYFWGKKFGKRRLIEHISPKKSLEGAIAGYLTTVAASLISIIYLPHAGFGHLLVLGMIVGVLAELGDLSESLIKRDVGMKDSGNLPGLGGILDVLDSLLLTVPFVYYYIEYYPGVY